MSSCRLRTNALVTALAVLLQGSIASFAADGATLEGRVEVPCDPSRVSEVAAVRIRPAEGGAPITVPVYGESGDFLGAGMSAGEYVLDAIDADGNALTPEPKRLVLQEGANQVVLSFEPPGCDETAGDAKPGPPQGRRGGFPEWKLSLIYVGAVGALALALDDRGDEPISPFIP